jgi:predicted nucleotide-binding protein
MNIEEAKALLKAANHSVSSESRLNNDTGWQLKLTSGQIVNVFDKGTVHVQGRDPGPVQELFTPGPSASGIARGGQISRRVFVVYGHDETSRTQLEAMLRRWDIEPLILDQLASEGMTLIEKLEHYQSVVTFAVILATPDDEGHRANQPSEKAFRARQNVVLELGMMLALLGRSKVAILIKSPDKMERPSDIQGLIYIPYKDHVSEIALPLAKEMNAQGLNIDLGKL